MDTPTLLIVAIIGCVVLLYQVYSLKGREDSLKKEITRLEANLSQSENDNKNKLAQLEGQIHNKAQEQFAVWQQKECETIRCQQLEIARREAITQLEQWKFEAEIFIRHDAIQRSQSVIVGKVTEHLVPYLPKFIYNPKDARFIGSPVDLIVFDGLDDGYLENIVFIEVKTGAASRLTRREQQIKEAIEQGRVKWVKMKVNHDKGDT